MDVLCISALCHQNPSQEAIAEPDRTRHLLRGRVASNARHAVNQVLGETAAAGPAVGNGSVHTTSAATLTSPQQPSPARRSIATTPTRAPYNEDKQQQRSMRILNAAPLCLRGRVRQVLENMKKRKGQGEEISEQERDLLMGVLPSVEWKTRPREEDGRDDEKKEGEARTSSSPSPSPSCPSTSSFSPSSSSASSPFLFAVEEEYEAKVTAVLEFVMMGNLKEELFLDLLKYMRVRWDPTFPE